MQRDVFAPLVLAQNWGEARAEEPSWVGGVSQEPSSSVAAGVRTVIQGVLLDPPER
jgi:hypothetical protein